MVACKAILLNTAGVSKKRKKNIRKQNNLAALQMKELEKKREEIRERKLS